MAGRLGQNDVKVNKTPVPIGKFTKIAITSVLIGQSTCL